MKQQIREWLRIALFIVTFFTVGIFHSLVIPQFGKGNVGIVTIQRIYLLSTIAFILLWGALLFYEAKCNFEGKPIRKFRNGEEFKVFRQMKVDAGFFLELAKFDNINDTRFYLLSPVHGKLSVLDESGKALEKFPDLFKVIKGKRTIVVSTKDKDQQMEKVTEKVYFIIPITSS